MFALANAVEHWVEKFITALMTTCRHISPRPCQNPFLPFPTEVKNHYSFYSYSSTQKRLKLIHSHGSWTIFCVTVRVANRLITARKVQSSQTPPLHLLPRPANLIRWLIFRSCAGQHEFTKRNVLRKCTLYLVGSA